MDEQPTTSEGAPEGAKSASGKRVLVVEDDEHIGPLVLAELERLGHEGSLATTLEDARARLGEGYDAILLDVRLPDGNGLDFLEDVRARWRHLPVTVMTAYAQVSAAVRAVRLGANDFLEKPFSREQLRATLSAWRNTTSRRRSESGAAGTETTRRRMRGRSVPAAFYMGQSKSLRESLDLIQLVAETPGTTALVDGESGTGKELAARAIHELGERKSQPFVAINCAALSESLLEAELFGYERGAFTGASNAKKGLFEVANGGTIYLDEVGEMQFNLQAKLLRVLEERTVKRVGGVTDLPVDVRVVASTNRNLEDEVDAGRFRQDLYFRLCVVRITMPPLRERKEDLGFLAQHFLKRFSLDLRRPLEGFTERALERLIGYDWPGNVRELRNVIERAVIVCRDERIDVRHLGFFQMGSGVVQLPDESSKGGKSASGRFHLDLEDLRLETAERKLIELALEEAEGRKSAAAELLGINRSTLYNKLKNYEL